MDFTYVYVLQSEVDPKRFYTGLTKDLRERIPEEAPVNVQSLAERKCPP